MRFIFILVFIISSCTPKIIPKNDRVKLNLLGKVKSWRNYQLLTIQQQKDQNSGKASHIDIHYSFKKNGMIKEQKRYTDNKLVHM